MTKCHQRDRTRFACDQSFMPSKRQPPKAGDFEGAEALETPWNDILDLGAPKFPLQKKLYLIFSLIIHLNITISPLLEFLFSSKDPVVKRRVSQFTSFSDRGYEVQFGPAKLWALWRANFSSGSKSRPNFALMSLASPVQSSSDRLCPAPSVGGLAGTDRGTGFFRRRGGDVTFGSGRGGERPGIAALDEVVSMLGRVGGRGCSLAHRRARQSRDEGHLE